MNGARAEDRAFGRRRVAGRTRGAEGQVREGAERRGDVTGGQSR